MTINIYIGDTSESLAAAAKAADPMAFLIDHSNLKEFLDSPKDDSTVYTSLGDLPKIPTGTKKVSDYDNAVYSLLDLADNIYYCPPDAWSDNKTINLTSVTDSLQGLTEYILYEFKQQKNIQKCNGEFHALPYLSSLKEYRRYLFFFPKTLWSSFYLFYTL